MKFFRKALSAVMALALTASVAAGCQTQTGSPGLETSGLEGPHGLKYAADQTLRTVYSAEAGGLNPFGSSGSAGDWNAVKHTTEGLMTTDVYGNIIPGLAESYEVSDDGLVYTFHLRQGLQYVNYKMETVGEMTAHDFVAVAKFICNPEFATGSTMFFEDRIVGANEYIAGTTTDFETVGYKALDDYTLEVTLQMPIPYWLQMGGSYMCVYAPYLEEVGEMYGTSAETLLAIGPYVMTEFQPEFRRVYEKNPYYYDSELVYIEKVIASYNKEASTIAPEMFLRGETDSANINTTLIDQWMVNSATKDIVIPGLPDTTYMYWYSFCYNPNFDEKYDVESYKLAIDNENFRQSIFWGFNRLKGLKCEDPYEGGEIRLVNSIVAPTWASYEGKDYTEYEPLASLYNVPNNYFNEEKALEYKEKAVEELTALGVNFPINFYMPYNPVINEWELEVQVLSQQLTELFGEDYIKFHIEAGPTTGFLAAVRRTGDYGFMRLNMGGGYKDPQAFTLAFDDATDSWTFMYQAETPNVKALYEEYHELLYYAKSVVIDIDERFRAFAEAEAFLIEHALVIPYRADTNGYYVTRTNEFENYGDTWKGLRVLAEPLSSEQFKLLHADWMEERAASQAN